MGAEKNNDSLVRKKVIAPILDAQTPLAKAEIIIETPLKGFGQKEEGG